MCNIVQRGWEQASLFMASVITCFSAVSRISQAIIFVPLKKFGFFVDGFTILKLSGCTVQILWHLV